MAGYAYSSKQFERYVDNNHNVGKSFEGPQGQRVTKKFETIPGMDPRKHVVLSEHSTRGTVDIILRRQNNSPGYEVIYRKYANHDEPSYNAFPVRDRIDDNMNELRQGSEADKRIVDEVLERQ